MSGPDARLTAAAARLGHEFGDYALLDEALTHPSAGSPARQNNQRLEFLGDRVLGLCISEALVARYPDEAEGDLAPRLNELVRKETCAEVAQATGMDAALKLGKSEVKTGGKRKTAILGDAMEAVIAAVYLDGGLTAAQALVARHWGDRIAAQGATAPRDAKTHLQEWAQGRSLKPPRYETVGRSGPDHMPLFRISVTLQSGETAEAEARSKRAAEQEAAARLIAELGLDT